LINSTRRICCGFVVQIQKAVQQVHNKSTRNPQQIECLNKLYNKSTTARHVEMLWICCRLVVLQPITTCHVHKLRHVVSRLFCLQWQLKLTTSTPVTKIRRPYNLYCVGADVKPCSINQSITYYRSVSQRAIKCIWSRQRTGVDMAFCIVSKYSTAVVQFQRVILYALHCWHAPTLCVLKKSLIIPVHLIQKLPVQWPVVINENTVCDRPTADRGNLQISGEFVVQQVHKSATNLCSGFN